MSSDNGKLVPETGLSNELVKVLLDSGLVQAMAEGHLFAREYWRLVRPDGSAVEVGFHFYEGQPGPTAYLWHEPVEGEKPSGIKTMKPVTPEWLAANLLPEEIT